MSWSFDHEPFYPITTGFYWLDFAIEALVSEHRIEDWIRTYLVDADTAWPLLTSCVEDGKFNLEELCLEGNHSVIMVDISDLCIIFRLLDHWRLHRL